MNRYINYCIFIIIYLLCFVFIIIDKNYFLSLNYSLYYLIPVTLIIANFFIAYKNNISEIKFSQIFWLCIFDLSLRTSILIYFYFIRNPVHDIDDYWGVVYFVSIAFIEILVLIVLDFIFNKLLKYLYKSKNNFL